jgi:osmotically inducible protein OsmC
MKTIYTAVATVHGGREGHVKSDDGVLDLDLRIPKSMGGAGFAACFESALRLVARQQRKRLKDARITAHVSLIANDAGHSGFDVELHGQIEGLSMGQTRSLMQAGLSVLESDARKHRRETRRRMIGPQ